MARKHNHASRVDQLHAELRVTHHGQRRQAAPPPAGAQFTVEQDGTVRDALGQVVYKPPQAKSV